MTDNPNDNELTLLEACVAKEMGELDKTWIEINNDYGKPYKNGDSLSRQYRKGSLGKKNIIARCSPKTAEELIDEEKIRQKVSQQNKIAKDNVKAAAQISIIADTLERACRVVEPYEVRRLETPTTSKREKTTPVLLLSDIQAGQKNSAEAMGTERDYDRFVLKDQMDMLMDGIVSISLKQLKEQRIIQILMLGDMVDGLGVFPGQAFHQDMDMYEQFFYLAEIMSAFLQELVQLYDKVEIYTVPGNHGRVGKHGENPNYLNWDNFWYKHMEQKMQNFTQIEWHITKAWWQLIDTNGWKTFITHGDTIRSYRGLPYYGIERKDSKQTKLLASRGLYYDYMAIGHFHQNTELPSPTGPIFINGSFPGGSVYSEKDLSSANRPQQKMFGVHKEWGKTWSFPIYLDY